MGNLGKQEAQNYMYQMRSAVGMHLITPDDIYWGRKGHERLARECGYALNDFNEEGQQEILKGSYGIIYVTGCDLKPILSAKEWINLMQAQIGREQLCK